MTQFLIRSVVRFALTCASIFTISICSAQSYTFSQISVPPFFDTKPQGINATGQIVGQYIDNVGAHGFLYSGGTYTAIDVPGADLTNAFGINDGGDIVGSYANDSGLHGFLLSHGSFTTIDAPSGVFNGSFNTSASGINSSEDIVGSYTDSSGQQHGFLLSKGSYHTIDGPGAISTTARGVNSAMQVAGSYRDAQGNHGFLLSGSQITSIDFPGASDTFVFGINDSSELVGQYSVGGSILSNGFTLSGLIFSTPPFVPGAATISATGVSEFGKIVGYYNNSTTNPFSGTVGFLATLQACPVNIKLSFNSIGTLLAPPGTSMDATFTPNGGISLVDAASACGFTGFNWQQQIEYVPPPNPFLEIGVNQGPPTPLTTPFFDPPPRGYFVPNEPISAYPFYFDPGPGGTPVFNTGTCAFIELEGAAQSLPFNTLCFHDAPADACLSGGEKELQTQYCGGNEANPGAALLFKTALVGVSSSFPSGVVLKEWEWLDNFNGTSDGFIVTLSNPGQADPGSGTGGITITSIDGVQLHPVPSTQISATASGLAYSRVTQTFNGTLTIVNIGVTPINGPIQVALMSLTPGVNLVNAAGEFVGNAYVTAPLPGNLGPGQSSVFTIQFKASANAKINFTPVIYSGSLN